MHKNNRIVSISLFLLSTFLLLPASAMGAGLDCLFKTGCERKICEIEKEIESAGAHGNRQKVARLKKELDEIGTLCRDGHGGGNAVRDFQDMESNVGEFSDKITRTADKFEAKTDRELRHAKDTADYARAWDDIGDELRESVRDLAEERRDLEEELDELRAGTGPHGMQADSTVKAAESLDREAVRALESVQSVRTTIDKTMDRVLIQTREMGADTQAHALRQEQKALALELERHKDLLGKIRELARTVARDRS